MEYSLLKIIIIIFVNVMIETCRKCGMIRATKDLVLLEDGEYICFSCWNKIIRDMKENPQT